MARVRLQWKGEYDNWGYSRSQSEPLILLPELSMHVQAGLLHFSRDFTLEESKNTSLMGSIIEQVINEID